MALFNFGKKKEEEKHSCCCGSEPKAEASTCCCGSAPKAEASACCCGKPVEGICCVKVLGAGCKSCHELYENTQAAVKAAGLELEVEYVTDMEKIMAYGVMSMPAIVVNETVVSSGKVLKTAEVEKLLKHYVG